jgi:hypothetical protein
VTTYRRALDVLLTSHERKLFTKLSSPRSIQAYLDTLPINFELRGETYMSPRRVVREKTAHCFEGALFAAAVLAYHGKKPLLLDFQTIPADEDHVVALFRDGRYWGAISKTNHSVLRWRDPVYRSVRELAMSFYHEYFLWNGSKSLRAYSRPFDLSRFLPERWATEEKDLFWLVERLDTSPHNAVAPNRNIQKGRRASAIELQALTLLEWEKNGTRRVKKSYGR